MSELAVVGSSIDRVDGGEKVTGARLYTGDVRRPGALWGKSLRSPYAHARITRLDVSAARSMPGVHAVITAEDLPTRMQGRRIYDIPVLARDRVRYVGDRIAAVAADSPELAEQAIEAMEVEYEELPAVFDPLEAMRQGAPLVHPDFASYRGAPTDLPPIPNVYSYITFGRGDVDAGFAQAELTFEDTYRLPMQHLGFIEPHGSVVEVDPAGHVRVWNTNKMPFNAKASLAELVEVAPYEVTVMPTSIGGDFGGKGALVDEPLAYRLSRLTGRPIRMVMRYTEELTAGQPRHATVVTIKSGLTRDGTLVAQHARLIFNTGAYAGNKPQLGLTGAESACGVYRTPHTFIEAYCVYTNQICCGHMRGPGWIQAGFSCESHMDALAARLEMDPVEFRRRNLLGPEDPPPNGHHWHQFRGREVLDMALGLGDWGSPKRAPNVGRGLSLTYEHVGTGHSGAIMSMDGNGQVKLITGVPDVGTGAHTLFRQLAAEVLTIQPERITVEIGDTDVAPNDSGSGADRVTHVAGTAVQGAASKLKDTLCDLAAELMGWPEGKVRLDGGQFHPDSADGTLSFDDLAQRAAQSDAQGRPHPHPLPEGEGVESVVQVRHDVNLDNAHLPDRNVTAQIADVEVDPDTGQVTVQKMLSVQDIGRVLNPRLAEGQVHGAATIGLGYAVLEELKVESGHITTPNFGDYRIPCAVDVPRFEVAFLPSEEGPSPYGAKAVGEVAVSGVAPAIANAVYDAVGVRITDLPITAEKVYDALQAARKAPSRDP